MSQESRRGKKGRPCKEFALLNSKYKLRKLDSDDESDIEVESDDDVIRLVPSRVERIDEFSVGDDHFGNTGSIPSDSDEGSLSSDPEDGDTHGHSSEVLHTLLNEWDDVYSDDSGSDIEDVVTEEADIIDVENKPETNSLRALRSNLAAWAIEKKISNAAVDDLLKILNSHPNPLDFQSLPNCARTLKKCPLKPQGLVPDVVEPGQYLHVGAERCIRQILKNVPREIRIRIIELLVGIDGLPLSKSSLNQVHPILIRILSVYSVSHHVVPTGIYHGYAKPNSAVDFLKKFVDEVTGLVNNGIKINNVVIPVRVKGFAMDAVEKSFVLGTPGHGGFWSCTRCDVKGKKKFNRVYFPIKVGNPRTHEDFINKTDPNHHKSACGIETIPYFDIVKNCSLDYMHLVLLGIVKKSLLKYWLEGSLQTEKLEEDQIDVISGRLLRFKSWKTCDFSRYPRSLENACRFKATECRFFLLYAGPVCLKDKLPNKMYRNFLVLHVAMSILLSAKSPLPVLDYVKNLLEKFVKDFALIYGKYHVSYNVHGLLHLCEDVPTFGSSEECSAFLMESELYQIKQEIKKGSQPHIQTVNRLEESFEFRPMMPRSISAEPQYKMSHNNGPLIESCSNPQYKVVNFSSFSLKASKPNCFCSVSDGNIVSISNICFSDTHQEMVLVGRKYMYKGNFYVKPLPSSSLGIFLVKSELSAELEIWPISSVCHKLMLLPCGQDFVAFPVLHTAKVNDN